MEFEEALRAALAAEESGDLVGGAAILEPLLQAADPRRAAEARLHLGRVRWKQGHLDEALDLCREASGTALRIGADDLRAQADNAMGVLHTTRGEYVQAAASYHSALERTPDPVTRGKILLNLGVIANIEGHLDLARQQYEHARALFKQSGDERNEALALHNMGMLHSDAGEWDEADDRLGRALALFEAQGNRLMIAYVLVNQSEVACGRGRPEEAIRLCDLALRMYAELGHEPGRCEALKWKGHGLRLLGEGRRAREVLGEALRMAKRLRLKLLEAETARELGAGLMAGGEAAAGRRLLERARRLFVALGAERDAEAVRSELGTDEQVPGARPGPDRASTGTTPGSPPKGAPPT